jgi:ATP-dependent RNA helicase RhlE
MSVRTVGILVVLIQHQKNYCLSGCDILQGRIMDLTLDNVIRFEEMQN